MLDKTTTTFSHVKPADTTWRSDGLRDFFLYKDLGVAEATAGRVIAHLVKANMDVLAVREVVGRMGVASGLRLLVLEQLPVPVHGELSCRRRSSDERKWLSAGYQGFAPDGPDRSQQDRRSDWRRHQSG